jgi:hypothetical protein
MKALFAIATASITLATATSYACSPAEAQFIGKVASIKQEGSGCTIRVDSFRFYQESMLCPLDASTLSSMDLPSRSCNLQVGEEVSGIASLDSQGNISW